MQNLLPHRYFSDKHCIMVSDKFETFCNEASNLTDVKVTVQIQRPVQPPVQQLDEIRS